MIGCPDSPRARRPHRARSRHLRGGAVLLHAAGRVRGGGHQGRAAGSRRRPAAPGHAGARAAFGALVALEHRRQSREGQVVDVALYEPMLRMLDELVPVYAATGYVRERRGSGTEYVVPHNHYRARDGRWVAIACTNDRIFERLAAAMERPQLA